MGQAFITRRGGFSHLSAENLKNYIGTSKYQYIGFDFKNKSYFFRIVYKESDSSTLHYYDFLVERGGALTEIASFKTGGYSEDFITSVTVDVAEGGVSINRKYATYIAQYPESICVVMD